MSAEYIMAGGNEQVILCERGIRTFDDYTRNTLDLAAVPMLQGADAPARHRRPEPCDRHRPPGRADGAGRNGRAARTASSSRCTTIPMHALCDGAQSLRPEVYDELAPKRCAASVR